MKMYHKIQSVFKRDEKGRMLFGEYSTDEFDYLKNNQWTFTEKVDGTNVRVHWDGKDVILGGRTDNAQIPTFLMQRLQNMFMTTPAKQIFRSMDNESMTLYGEGYGAKIQKGGGNYKADGVDFVLFDVQVGGWWLKRKDVVDIAISFRVGTVPELVNGTLPEMVSMVRKGLGSMWGEFPAEGIVARPVVELQGRNGKRIITKIKHKDY